MLIIFIVLTLLTTLLYHFNILSTTVVNYLKIIIPVLTTIIGGITVGKRSTKKGWLEGLKVGALFIILLFLLTYLGFQSAIHLRTWIYYIILMISTTLGSMIGINKKTS